MKEMISYISKFARENHRNLYIVGGYVRDKLMDPLKEPEDLDIVFQGHMDEIINYLKIQGGTIFPLKQELGMYRMIKGDKVVDISALKGKTIEEDLSSRDFTINAIAFNLKDNTIIDPFTGRSHIKNRIIKEVSEESIKNDRVRILRGIRILIKNGMHFSVETEVNVRSQSKYIRYCTKERVFQEIMKIIYCDKDGKAFDILDTYGVLREIIPYVEEHKVIGKCKYHIEDVFTHMNTVYKVFKELLNGSIEIENFDLQILNRNIGEFSLRDYIAFAAFNHDIGKYPCYKKVGNRVSFINHEKVGVKIINEFCSFWGFPKEARKIIVKTIEGHMYPLALFKAKLKDYKKSFYKFFKTYEEYTPYILIVSFCDVYATTLFKDINNEKELYVKFIQKLLEEYKIYENTKNKRLIKGDELKKAFNFKDEEIGSALLKIEEMAYRGVVENKEQAVNFISKCCIMNK